MLPIRFNLGAITTTKIAADIEVNVKDEYRNLVYLAKPEPHQVPISFIGMPLPTPSDIRITDSNENPEGVVMVENSFRARAVQVQNAKIFEMGLKSAIITDVANEETNGAPIPLFRKHMIMDGIHSGYQVLDVSMNPVSGNRHKLIVENDEVAVYHNLDPSLDPSTLKLSAYFIRYTNAAGEQVFSLLNTAPAFSEATILDGLQPTKRTYSVRPFGFRFQYRIHYIGPAPFYIKVDERAQLKLNTPVLIRPNDAWNLHISDGALFGLAGAATKFYSLPEYHFQQFSPIEPRQYSNTAECVVLTNHIAKTPMENILMDENSPVEILITDETLSPKVAWTTASLDVERFWVDRMDRIQEEAQLINIQERSLQERGISIQNEFGLVHIPIEIAEGDRVFIRAHFESKSLKYLGLNLNPLHTRSLQTGKAIVYCVPEDALQGNVRAVHHMILDKDESIIEWSDYRLESAPGVLDPGLAPAAPLTGLDQFKASHPTFLILGSVSVNRNSNPYSLSYIDVREKGGVLTGAVRRNMAEELDSYPELQWVEDQSYKARPFPGLGVLTVDVPFSILEDGGGNFTRESVDKLVRKHMALGGHPIIKYYADVPEVLEAQFDTDTEILTLAWSEVPHADSYRVYVAVRSEGPFLSVDLVGSAAGAPANSLTDTLDLSAAGDAQVSASTALYVYIAPLLNEIEWPESKLAYLDLTVIGGAGLFTANAVIVSPPVTTAVPATAVIIAEA
tara:strand:+ start:60 stop:2264 length:2205 start_codon:yes stop_codon:yes gene_type:complete